MIENEEELKKCPPVEVCLPNGQRTGKPFGN